MGSRFPPEREGGPSQLAQTAQALLPRSLSESVPGELGFAPCVAEAAGGPFGLCPFRHQ